MNSPSTSFPIAARDALYRLFRTFLDHPEHADYLRDRVPRYLNVLDYWKGQPREGGLDDHLRLGQALFNAGLFFDCHEYLEAVWKETPEREEKTLLQGLIQVAAALHKLELDPYAFAGALYLIDHGMKKLESARSANASHPPHLAALIEIRNRMVAEHIDLSDLPKVKLI